ncbi:MAG TPA: 2TM domain-containing protein [Azospirillaceae bacterium]|nr:2TM domain-containing protein [Azospirillaceae bacterium]
MTPDPVRQDPYRSPTPGEGPDTTAARRRSGLLNHFLAYFAVAVVLVPVNFLTTPDRPWFYIPLVLWMAPLAVHVAWAMGLFGRK